MALSLFVGNAGFTAEKLETKATLSFDTESLTITAIQLDLVGRVPGMEMEQFVAAANEAKANCPVSKVLKAEISLSVTLERNHSASVSPKNRRSSSIATRASAGL